MSKLRLIFLIILIPIGFFQCNTDNPVPEVYVNFIIQLNDPNYLVLNSITNSKYIPYEGNKGIIVTRVEQDKFIAYDATCTYDPEDSNGIIEIDGISGVCKGCGSKFNLLIDGFIETGPATLPLKTYVVSYNPNAQELLIHN